MKRVIYFALTLILTPTIGAAQGKYKTVTIDLDKNAKAETKTASGEDALIERIAEEALGPETQYKSKKQRVLTVNQTEQLAGKNKGQFLIQVSYLSDPALLGPKNVTKDGLLVDAMRVVESLLTNPKVKSLKASEFMLMPSVVSADGNVEQVMKIVVPIKPFKSIDWSKMDGATFEKLVKTNGSINIAPFFIHNGGKFLILKPEQLDL